MHSKRLVAVLLNLIVICLSSSVEVESFHLFQPKFCKSLESFESKRELNYTASITASIRSETHRLPINVLCKLREDQSICYAYLRHDLIRTHRLFVPDHIRKPADLSDLQYKLLQAKLPGVVVGYIIFRKPLTEMDFILVGSLVTDNLDKRMQGITVALMATVFDITYRCKFDGVKIAPAGSAVDICRHIGMELVGDARYWGDRKIAFQLRDRANLALVSIK